MTTSVIKEEDIKKGGAYNVRDVLKPLTRLNVMEAGMTGNQVSHSRHGNLVHPHPY